MNPSITHHLAPLRAICILLTVFALGAQADVIFEDSFDRSAALHNSSPEPMNGPGATWNDTAAMGGSKGLSTENKALVLTNLTSFVSLPYTLSYAPAKSVVTLSAKFTVASGNGKAWVALGFSGNNYVFRTGTAWMRFATNGKIQLVKGPGYNDVPRTVVKEAAATDKSVELKISYDTSNNLATFYLDDASVGTFTYDAMPDITRVFIACMTDENDSLSGSVQDFKLEVTQQP